MIPKFDLKNFEKLKNNEIILECEFCHILFSSTKKIVRRALGITKHHKTTALKFCSRKCYGYSSRTRISLNCFECDNPVTRFPKDLKRVTNVFCSKSCSAINSNKNKKTGNNRSQMEVWIEEEINKIFNLDIKFNNREICNGMELDIYIPILNLAFELNGIFHYSPIFGEDKLKIIGDRDLKKISECVSRGIDLVVIDTSDSKKFDKIKDKKYLEYIIYRINEKLIQN